MTRENAFEVAIEFQGTDAFLHGALAARNK